MTIQPPAGRGYPAGNMTAAAAAKLATQAQQLVDHLEDFERRRQTDRRIYVSLLTLAVLFSATAAGGGIGLVAILHVSQTERTQVLEHRERNEESHDALCKQINRLAAQAHLQPAPCPSPIQFTLPPATR